MAPHDDDPLPGLPTVATAAAVTFGFADGSARDGRRPVATEVPVQVLFGGVPFGIMMATPADLEDFAFGFSLTEGVVAAPHEIRGVRVEPGAGAVRLAVDVAGARLQAHLARK